MHKKGKLKADDQFETIKDMSTIYKRDVGGSELLFSPFNYDMNEL